MSADLWNHNLSIIHPLSVHVAIISEPNAQISFKFWLLFPLAQFYAETFFEILKKKKKFSRFYCEYFSFSLTIGTLIGSENFKMLLLLQIAAKSFQTFPEFPF